MLKQAHIVNSEIGTIAPRSLSKAEASGATIRIRLLQIVCSIDTLVTIPSNHILLAEACAIDLVTHLQFGAGLVATALLAVREVKVSIGANITGPALDILPTLAGSIEQIALGVSIGNAHRIACTLLAANDLVDNEMRFLAPAVEG